MHSHWGAPTCTTSLVPRPVARKSDSFPLRKIVETVDEEWTFNGQITPMSFDVLECGHRKKIFSRHANGRSFEAPNTNRRCEPCYKEGRS